MIQLSDFASFLAGRVEPSSTLLVALSGGVDSVVLAHLASRLVTSHSYRIHAVYVHHGLNPQADQWALFCQSLCETLSIGFECRRVDVHCGPRQSLEAQAREARYQVLADYARRGDIILTAHHQDDQAETLLLNLKRGSGVAGLAAMPKMRPFYGSLLLRPLLNYPRSAIETYASRYQLSHVVDDSNFDQRIERNFLRHQVMPLLRERWPDMAAQMAQSCELLQESQMLHDELAMMDAHQYCHPDGSLDEQLQSLSVARQRNLIRYWLKQQSGQYPTRNQLASLQQQFSARDDGQPQIRLGEGALRRFKQRWYWVNDVFSQLPNGCCWHSPYQPFTAPHWSLTQVAGGSLMAPDKAAVVSIRFRREVGNPMMRPYGRGGQRPLKKLLQELGFAPWLRDWVPLIYYDEQLIAIADRLIDESVYQAQGDGWQLNWQIYAGTSPDQLLHRAHSLPFAPTSEHSHSSE